MLLLVATKGVNRDFPRNAFRLCSVVLSWLSVLARGLCHSRSPLGDRSISYFLLPKASATTRTSLPVKFVGLNSPD